MLTEIKARLSLPMPLFWKKLQKRTAATSAAFGALTVTVSTIANHLPAIVPTALGYATAIFGGIAAACTLAVDDPAALPAPDEATPSPPTSDHP